MVLLAPLVRRGRGGRKGILALLETLAEQDPQERKGTMEYLEIPEHLDRRDPL